MSGNDLLSHRQEPDCVQGDVLSTHNEFDNNIHRERNDAKEQRVQSIPTPDGDSTKKINEQDRLMTRNGLSDKDSPESYRANYTQKQEHAANSSTGVLNLSADDVQPSSLNELLRDKENAKEGAQLDRSHTTRRNSQSCNDVQSPASFPQHPIHRQSMPSKLTPPHHILQQMPHSAVPAKPHAHIDSRNAIGISNRDSRIPIHGVKARSSEGPSRFQSARHGEDQQGRYASYSHGLHTSFERMHKKETRKSSPPLFNYNRSNGYIAQNAANHHSQTLPQLPPPPPQMSNCLSYVQTGPTRYSIPPNNKSSLLTQHDYAIRNHLVMPTPRAYRRDTRSGLDGVPPSKGGTYFRAGQAGGYQSYYSRESSPIYRLASDYTRQKSTPGRHFAALPTQQLQHSSYRSQQVQKDTSQIIAKPHDNCVSTDDGTPVHVRGGTRSESSLEERMTCRESLNEFTNVGVQTVETRLASDKHASSAAQKSTSASTSPGVSGPRDPHDHAAQFEEQHGVNRSRPCWTSPSTLDSLLSFDESLASGAMEAGEYDFSQSPMSSYAPSPSSHLKQHHGGRGGCHRLQPPLPTSMEMQSPSWKDQPCSETRPSSHNLGVVGRLDSPLKSPRGSVHGTGGGGGRPVGVARRCKRVRRKCTVDGCANRVVQGGVCIQHGAKRKACSHLGCTKNVKKAGLCSAHGPARKRCGVPGCQKVSVQGGRCISHGAKKKLCSAAGCAKQAIMKGMCKKHHDTVHLKGVSKLSTAAASSSSESNVEEGGEATKTELSATPIHNEDQPKHIFLDLKVDDKFSFYPDREEQESTTITPGGLAAGVTNDEDGMSSKLNQEESVGPNLGHIAFEEEADWTLHDSPKQKVPV